MDSSSFTCMKEAWPTLGVRRRTPTSWAGLSEDGAGDAPASPVQVLIAAVPAEQRIPALEVLVSSVEGAPEKPALSCTEEGSKRRRRGLAAPCCCASAAAVLLVLVVTASTVGVLTISRAQRETSLSRPVESEEFESPWRPRRKIQTQNVA
eukprot:jgi/Tetstr1/458943/TSEL_004414.t1